MLDKQITQQLIDHLNEELQPAFILLFGSHAKGTARHDSDIDIAYFSKKNMSAYERFLVAGDLALIAGCEVDLIDLKQIDTVFTLQIFEQGIPLFIQDEAEFTRQKMRAYSMYATLSEQRAEIIEAIQKRGSVFGNE